MIESLSIFLVVIRIVKYDEIIIIAGINKINVFASDNALFLSENSDINFFHTDVICSFMKIPFVSNKLMIKFDIN